MFVLRAHSAEVNARMFAPLGARSGSTEMCSTNGCPAAAAADALYLVPSSTGGHTHQSTTTSSMMTIIVIVTLCIHCVDSGQAGVGGAGRLRSMHEHLARLAGKQEARGDGALLQNRGGLPQPGVCVCVCVCVCVLCMVLSSATSILLLAPIRHVRCIGCRSFCVVCDERALMFSCKDTCRLIVWAAGV